MSDPRLTPEEWRELHRDAEDALRALGRVTPDPEDDENYAACSELIQHLANELKRCHTLAAQSQFQPVTTPKN